ncbi:MAG: hypothetical protein J6X44_06665, partial [Thermoguttaceae bacterium]|nr:hypothetical protein [Thermoguttaceae bacterium]
MKQLLSKLAIFVVASATMNVLLFGADNSLKYDVSAPLKLTKPGEIPIGEHFKPTTDFKAKWIAATDLPDPILPNLWQVHRKTFDLDNVPERALARIACDSKYWLYV